MFALPGVTFGRMENNLTANPATIGTLITTGATPHNKSLFSAGELIAATTFDSYLMALTWHNTVLAANASHQLTDIGIGASGSEVAFINNIQTGYGFGAGLMLPLYIPKGSRLSARMQGALANDTVNIAIWLFGGPSGLPWPTFTRVDSFGETTADSGGLAHTPGTSGALSTWTNIGTTTTRPYGGIFPMIQGVPGDTTLLNMTLHIEMGITSTTYGQWLFKSFSDESVIGPFPNFPCLRPIPTGSQLMIRSEASGTPESYEMVTYAIG